MQKKSDKKPSIRALERAQDYLKMPIGRVLSGQLHEYKQHGTALFSAADIARFP